MAPRKAAVLRHDERSLREHLIATAVRLIATDGTAGLTVRGIARAAGVADGVLYNHFADKEELLANALHAHVREVELGLPALPEPGVGEVAANLAAHLDHGLAMHRAILPAFTGLVGQRAVLARFAELAGSGENWRECLTRYLRAEQDLGRLAPHADVDVAASLLVGVCHDAVLSMMFPLPAAKSVDVDSVVVTVMQGIVR